MAVRHIIKLYNRVPSFSLDNAKEHIVPNGLIKKVATLPLGDIKHTQKNKF